MRTPPTAVTSSWHRCGTYPAWSGYEYKTELITLLKELGHDVQDFGTDSETSVDYPDFIRPAAEAVARGEADRAVVLGGSGNGEQMAANKVRGIRAALCWNTTTARLARQHNDANVISIGQRVMGIEEAKDAVAAFMSTDFEGGRHVRRIEKLEPSLG